MENQHLKQSEQEDRSQSQSLSAPQSADMGAQPPSDPSGIHAAANQSPQVQQLKSYQEVANGSAQVSQLKSLQAGANQGALQRKAVGSPSAPIQMRWANEGSLSQQQGEYLKTRLQQDPLAALLEMGRNEGMEAELATLEKLRANAGNFPAAVQAVNETIQTLIFGEGIWTTLAIVIKVEDIIDSFMEGGDEAGEESHDFAGEAPEEIIDPWNDVYAELLSSDLFMRIIYNWVLFKGYSVENFESKYWHWFYNGVTTREGFQQIFNTPQQRSEPIQMARTPNTVSTQAQYQTKNFGQFQNVSYMRDGVGNIDFTSTHGAPTTWQNPVKGGSLINLNHGSKQHRYGIMSSGKKVEIPKASRSQHFAIGDRLLPGNGRAGAWTWHHLSSEYEMVLVDMTVHAKHGHNGGVHLWK